MQNAENSPENPGRLCRCRTAVLTAAHHWGLATQVNKCFCPQVYLDNAPWEQFVSNSSCAVLSVLIDINSEPNHTHHTHSGWLALPAEPVTDCSPFFNDVFLLFFCFFVFWTFSLLSQERHDNPPPCRALHPCFSLTGAGNKSCVITAVEMRLRAIRITCYVFRWKFLPHSPTTKKKEKSGAAFYLNICRSHNLLWFLPHLEEKRNKRKRGLAQI